jgi:predicted AlkP superfamily phosphohydrolase/phosphomutase
VDPRHPEYDPQTAPRYEQAMLRCYQMADSLVAVVADAIGSDANLIVLGDHGQDIQHSIFRVNEWLAAEGYLFWENEGMAIDWGRTKVCALGNYIYINQLGREPSGIVAPSETDQLKTVLIEKLLGITDPSTGSRPILIVGDKYEFELLGANGQGVGDLVFCLCSGYQAANNRGEVFSKTKNLAEFTSGHDHFWPLDPRIHTRFFARGPSFRSGYVHPRTARLEDVAPTLCAVLGVSPSDDCEGKILQDLLSVEKSQSKRRND